MKLNDIQPIGDFVMVKELDLSGGDYQMGQGLVTPDTVSQWIPPQQGQVLAVGRDVTMIRPGQKVLYGLGAGRKHEGLGVIFLREGDLISELT